MTTTREEKVATTTVPEALTEEHHEALKASWELPAWGATDTDARTAQAADRQPAGGGAGSGLETVLASGLTIGGPLDANGMILGRRVAPIEAGTPGGIPAQPASDTNGATLGRRIAPIETE